MIELMLFFSMIKQAKNKTLLFLLLVCGLSFAQKNTPHTFIVNTNQGFIDYSNRIIVCRGTADIEERTPVDNSLNIVEKKYKNS